jgi:hypothetical protein
LQATGIVFNVILVRSSVRRDKQFSAFDHNERTTILAQRTIGGTALVNTLQLRSGQNYTHDVELAAKTVNNANDHEQHSEFPDTYPAGIKVTKTVIFS